MIIFLTAPKSLAKSLYFTTLPQTEVPVNVCVEVMSFIEVLTF